MILTHPCPDWTALRETAERLAADRAAGDPAARINGKPLPAATIDARARCARALVLLWQAVEQHRDVPDLPATIAEIRADLSRATAAAARIAQARPNDATQARHAALLAAMAHHLSDWRDNPACGPAILFCHEINQQRRAERATRKAA